MVSINHLTKRKYTTVANKSFIRKSKLPEVARDTAKHDKINQIRDVYTSNVYHFRNQSLLYDPTN